MEALRYNITIESDTIKLPALSRYIGKKMEIIFIEDETESGKPNNSIDIKQFKGKIIFDEESIQSLRDNSLI
jgi:hypothetical protein